MKRTAPDPEWVQMYRQGIPTSKIAAEAGVAATTVRYHLQIAARAEPGIREEHKTALPTVTRQPNQLGLWNLADLVAFHQAKDRLPSSHGKSARERALAAWLGNRRRQAAQGTLSPAYREGLAVIPGWDKTSRSKADDEARWQQRLDELLRIRAASGDWPLHQKTDDLNERMLGVWLHGQRIEYRAGRLDRAKEKKLNEILPGWQEGRGHRGGRRTSR